MFTFERAQKKSKGKRGSRGYNGISVGASGLYISTQASRETGLEKHDAAIVDVDNERGAVLITPVNSRQEESWALTPNRSGGMSIGTGAKDFNERLGLKKGRYESRGRHEEGYLFIYNPDL